MKVRLGRCKIAPFTYRRAQTSLRPWLLAVFSSRSILPAQHHKHSLSKLVTHFVVNDHIRSTVNYVVSQKNIPVKLYSRKYRPPTRKAETVTVTTILCAQGGMLVTIKTVAMVITIFTALASLDC